MSFSRFDTTQSQSSNFKGITIETMTQNFLNDIKHEKPKNFVSYYDIKVGDKYLKFNFNQIPDQIEFKSKEIFGVNNKGETSIYKLDLDTKILNHHYFFNSYISHEDIIHFSNFLETGGYYEITFNEINNNNNPVLLTGTVMAPGTSTNTNKNNSNNSKDEVNLPLIIGVSVGGFVLLAIIVYYFMRKGRRSRGSNKVSNNRMNANRGGTKKIGAKKTGRGKSK